MRLSVKPSVRGDASHSISKLYPFDRDEQRARIRDLLVRHPATDQIRLWIREFVSTVAATYDVWGPILDAGCGYRSNEPEMCRFTSYPYYTFDVEPKHQPDYIGSLERMEFGDAMFGTVICTEVLEHVKDERAAISELHRVLRPGGLLIVTVPFYHGIHENSAADDYRRFTPKGLRMLLRDFRDINVETRGDPVRPPCVFATARR